MKKSLWIVLLLALICTLALSACDDTNQSQTPNEDHVHAFSEWTTTKKANCTEDGVNERYCACGEKQTQSVSALGHTNVIDDAVAATCTTEGKTEGKHCTVCNEVIVAQTTIGKLGHVEVIDAAVAATCTTEGKTEGKHCSVCSEVLVAQTTVGKLGHVEVIDAAVAATCTTEGLTEGKHCSVCREVIKSQTTTPKQEHLYKFYKCTICGVENIPDQGLSFYLRNDNKYIVSVGTAVYLTTIVIPSSHNGLPVVQVGSFENSMVETLVLPDSIIILNTLGDMERLTNIYFDGSIDEWCSISLSPSYTLEQLYVKDLNDEYSKPTKVTVSSLRAYSLFRCSSLTEITILSGAEYIGEGALACCNNLTKVTIPETVSEIDVQAFYGCTALEEITIPSGVTSIQYGAFGACTKLTKMYFVVPEGWSVDSSILSNPYTAAEYIVEKGNFKFTRK